MSLIRKILPYLMTAAMAVCAHAAIAQTDVQVDAGRGPVSLRLPAAFDGVTPLPLVLNLHGYQNNGEIQQEYFGLLEQTDVRGLMVAAPDGLEDLFGLRYWNATDACCDFGDDAPDDSSYLRNLIEVIAGAFPVDAQRVYVVGYSNGGFMSHRMACDHADRVAAIFSFAGAQWDDPAQCSPSEPVSVVQLHGTNDNVIRYRGGCIPGLACYPSARTTTDTWAVFNGCDAQPGLRLPLLDLVTRRDGGDTLRQEYTACLGGAVELWTTLASGHSASFEPFFAEAVIDFLLAHPKPLR